MNYPEGSWRHRESLLERIAKLIELGTSDNYNEAARAVDKAEDLIEQHSIKRDELHWNTKKDHDIICAARFLNLRGIYTVRASAVGGERSNFLVTGHGELSAGMMMAAARVLGWEPRWGVTEDECRL